MFSIVETIGSDGKKEVSVVKSSWINGEIVSWPDNYQKAIKKNSEPNSNWEKYGCRILRGNIDTLLEAKRKERHYEVFSVTESECENVGKGKAINEIDLNTAFDNPSSMSENKQTEPPVELDANNEKENSVSPLLNSATREKLFAAVSDIFAEGHNADTVTSSVCTPRASPISKRPSAYVSPSVRTADSFIIQNEEQTIPLPRKDTKENECNNKVDRNITKIKRKQEEILNRLDTIENRIGRTEKRTKRILEEIMTIKEVQKNAVELLQALTTTHRVKIPIITKDMEFSYPNVRINTVEDINLFNSKLTENYYMEQMVVRLHKYRTPNMNKSVKNIFEHLFAYSLIRQYTWTGQSGLIKGITKQIFMDLSNITVLVENVLNYLNADAPVTTAEVKKSIQEFLKRSSVYAAKQKN